MIIPFPGLFYWRNRAKAVPLFLLVASSVLVVGTVATLTGSVLMSVYRANVKPYEAYSLVVSKQAGIPKQITNKIVACEHVEEMVPVLDSKVKVKGLFGTEGRTILAVPEDRADFCLARIGLRVKKGRLPYAGEDGIAIHEEIATAKGISIGVLSKLLKIDFGFGCGDTKKGMKYLAVFTVVFTIIALIIHILMYVYDQLPTYDFSLNTRNIIGTLSFQLFLSGTSEEILFRALPITVLVYVFGNRVYIKGHITLEIIISSFLFSIAHMKWSLSPLTIDANLFQLFYAFVLGTIQGIAYQESQSVLYPMLMHSLANVLMVGTGYLFILLS
jgi:membrane protease YdiL (CAAX protease family)